LLCGLAVFLSRKMQQNRNLSRKQCLAFKVFFFIAFSLWAIYADFRHYKVSEQMLTFYSVNLIMTCFIIFKPWIGMVLSGSAYLILYFTLFFFDRAAGIEPLNYIVLAFATIACNTVHYHSHIHACRREHILEDSNKALEKASRRDGLTGLQNRLALEEDAAETDGRHMTAFMIDINYFKEINDQYGHVVGDQLLKETSKILQQLFPGAHYYRYGGDEFLVLTHKPAQDNYGAPTYDFTHGESGAKVSLSIGSAQGEPSDYDELFELISQADKALYTVKERTHSVEFGGHERRRRNVENSGSLPQRGRD
jgi:diguanylate cyclase (GGDEF)-like protein